MIFSKKFIYQIFYSKDMTYRYEIFLEELIDFFVIPTKLGNNWKDAFIPDYRALQ